VALQREHRIFDRRFGPATHFGDQSAQPVDFVVKRLDCMFCHDASLRADQP